MINKTPHFLISFFSKETLFYLNCNFIKNGVLKTWHKKLERGYHFESEKDAEDFIKDHLPPNADYFLTQDLPPYDYSNYATQNRHRTH